jgi:hypothetical protein
MAMKIPHMRIKSYEIGIREIHQCSNSRNWIEMCTNIRCKLYVMFYSRNMVTYTSDVGLTSVVNHTTKSSVTIRIMTKYFDTSARQVKGPFRHVKGGLRRDSCGRHESS